MALKRRVLSASRAVRLEPSARKLQRLLEPDDRRRNRRDDEHLRVLMAGVLKRDSHAVDVGANVGSVLADICALAPQGQHVAVEPLPDLAAELAKRFPAVTVHQCALSETGGARSFVRDQRQPSRSGFRSQAVNKSASELELVVPAATLDEIIPTDRQVAFLKLDVEGAEEEVLRGGLRTLRRCQPVIAFEHGASAVHHYGTTHRAIHRLLTEEIGLSIFDMDGGGPLSDRMFDEVADPPGSRWNFFARPW